MSVYEWNFGGSYFWWATYTWVHNVSNTWAIFHIEYKGNDYFNKTLPNLLNLFIFVTLRAHEDDKTWNSHKFICSFTEGKNVCGQHDVICLVRRNVALQLVFVLIYLTDLVFFVTVKVGDINLSVGRQWAFSAHCWALGEATVPSTVGHYISCTIHTPRKNCATVYNITSFKRALHCAFNANIRYQCTALCCCVYCKAITYAVTNSRSICAHTNYILVYLKHVGLNHFSGMYLCQEYCIRSIVLSWNGRLCTMIFCHHTRKIPNYLTELKYGYWWPRDPMSLGITSQSNGLICL